MRRERRVRRDRRAPAEDGLYWRALRWVLWREAAHEVLTAAGSRLTAEQLRERIANAPPWYTIKALQRVNFFPERAMRAEGTRETKRPATWARRRGECQHRCADCANWWDHRPALCELPPDGLCWRCYRRAHPEERGRRVDRIRHAVATAQAG